MKTLKEFIAKRKYVAVVYDDDSQKKLREWATDNGFDLTVKYNGDEQDPKDFNFHTTIFHSVNEVNLRNSQNKEKPTEVIISGIKFLGENKDIPVLSLSLSGGLKDIREHFERLGLEDEWPTYKPHISLSYAKKQIDVSNIKLPDFRPKFDKIKIEDIEE
jgi:hypothetical protein